MEDSCPNRAVRASWGYRCLGRHFISDSQRKWRNQGKCPFLLGVEYGQQVNSDGFLHQRAVLALSLLLFLGQRDKAAIPMSAVPVTCPLSSSYRSSAVEIHFCLLSESLCTHISCM